ncbi:hypothetical protein [Novosphingobium sp.]|uniref:hypothetical protein n=1 Tax=Novosphingobium sp. TaxID=1874826 RepID=UPI003BA9DFB6
MAQRFVFWLTSLRYLSEVWLILAWPKISEDHMTPSRVTFLLCAGLVFVPVAAVASTISIEGTAALSGGSINPPDPVEGCNKAKMNAEEKASQAGTVRLISWDRLSNDSDCSLSTQRVGSIGYYFIFKARGQFEQ